MWYPFKFWRNVSYSCIDGVLAKELGGSRPSWTHRRRGRIARRRDPGFLVATVDRAPRPIVEGWSDSPDHRFDSIILRFPIGTTAHIWTHTRERAFGSMFHVEPGEPPTTIECRSGPMIIWATTIEGRTVDVLHTPGVPIAAEELRLTPLHAVTDGPG